MMDIGNGISVIICCYNSEQRIRDVLGPLKKQTGTEGIPWEVILVDNASTDQTATVARDDWADFTVPLEIVFEGTPGLSSARRKGLVTSRYPLVIFVDDDNLVAEDYISRAYQIMNAHPEVGLAGGLGKPVTSKSLPAWFHDFQVAYAVGPQAEKDGYVQVSRGYLHGAGLVMRKHVWEAIQSTGIGQVLSDRKGKSLSSGGDYEISLLFRMAGFSMWYDSNLVFEHILPDGRMQWAYMKKLIPQFGRTKPVIQLYRSEIGDFKGILRLMYRNWVLALMFRLGNFLRFLPPYLSSRRKPQEGRWQEFDFLYHRGELMQHLELCFRYPAIKKEIRQIRKSLADQLKTGR
jgi:glycosyltransferase involved in cell wall biosynthesis